MKFLLLTMIPLRRVLVLHGKGSSGPEMESQFKKIKVSLPMLKFDFPTAPHPEGNGYAWWKLGQGERSFTAKEYVGLQESLAVLRTGERYLGVWGHSQGAILLAAILAKQHLYGGCFGQSAPVFPHSRSIKYILNGAAWPKPFEEDFETCTTQSKSRILHCYGRADTINPPDQAQRIADVLGGATFVHDGGHYVPDDKAALAAYRTILLDNPQSDYADRWTNNKRD